MYVLYTLTYVPGDVMLLNQPQPDTHSLKTIVELKLSTSLRLDGEHI